MDIIAHKAPAGMFYSRISLQVIDNSDGEVIRVSGSPGKGVVRASREVGTMPSDITALP